MKNQSTFQNSRFNIYKNTYINMLKNTTFNIFYKPFQYLKITEYIQHLSKSRLIFFSSIRLLLRQWRRVAEGTGGGARPASAGPVGSTWGGRSRARQRDAGWGRGARLGQGCGGAVGAGRRGSGGVARGWRWDGGLDKKNCELYDSQTVEGGEKISGRCIWFPYNR